MILRARSTSAQYQKGLIETACTSIPISSKSARRFSTSLCMLAGPSGFASVTSPARPSRLIRSLTRSQASGTRTCAWMSTTAARWPPTTTSRRLRPATGGAADCGGFGENPNEDSAQQQLVKKIPAAVLDTALRNSLRFGIVTCQYFCLLRFPFGPSGWAYLYTRGRSEGTALLFLV